MGYSKSVTKNELLYIAAISNCVSVETLHRMNNADVVDESIDKQLSIMKRDRLVSVTKAEQGQFIKLLKNGLNVIEENDKETAKFFKKYSHNCNIKTDQKHIGTYLNQGDIHYMMLRSKIKVGTGKPTVAERIQNGKSKSEQLGEDNSYYMLKELTDENGNALLNVTKSRSSGIIITPAITGPVYRVHKNDERVYATVEAAVRINIGAALRSMYKDIYNYVPNRSILIGDSYETAMDILNNECFAKGSRNITYGNMVATTKKNEFMFFPLNLDGADLLRMATMFTRDKICAAIFSRDEIENAKEKICDAYLPQYNLDCYEMITCDLSRIYQIKKLYFEESKYRQRMESNLGFACIESQKPFLREYFKGKQIRFRTITIGEGKEYVPNKTAAKNTDTKVGKQE